MGTEHQDEGAKQNLFLQVLTGGIDAVLEKEHDVMALLWMSDVLHARILDGKANAGQLALLEEAFTKVTDKFKILSAGQPKQAGDQRGEPETKEQRKVRALKRIDKFMQYFDSESGHVVGHDKESLANRRRDAEANLKMLVDLDESELSVWLQNLKTAKDSKKLPAGILGVALIGMTAERSLRSNLQDAFIETIEILIGKK